MDIAVNLQEPVFSSHSGTITGIERKFGPTEYAKNSYGNYVEVSFNVGNDKWKLLFGHLGEISPELEVGKSISAGVFIGTGGLSGNAGYKNGEPQSGMVPHVHIRGRENGKSTDPAKVLNTKFNKSNGQATNNPCGF
ncbi:M23 family metallopeptidase [Sphingobacterium detergens]|uniref:M23 family metallopeptidase n=1 Tax=Sphingobacterium detergens TaxID=1145106 RepID=UPI002446DB39|nr:M23 family metallopeptidase [Sphingobacterium detergens]